MERVLQYQSQTIVNKNHNITYYIRNWIENDSGKNKR